MTLVSSPETQASFLVLQTMAPELSGERVCPDVSHFVSPQQV